MDILYEEMNNDDIYRLGEISRREIIESTYIARYNDKKRSIEISEKEHNPPIIVSDWDANGVNRRINNWKKSLDNGGFMYGRSLMENLKEFV